MTKPQKMTVSKLMSKALRGQLKNSNINGKHGNDNENYHKLSDTQILALSNIVERDENNKSRIL